MANLIMIEDSVYECDCPMEDIQVKIEEAALKDSREIEDGGVGNIVELNRCSRCERAIDTGKFTYEYKYPEGYSGSSKCVCSLCAECAQFITRSMEPLRSQVSYTTPEDNWNLTPEHLKIYYGYNGDGIDRSHLPEFGASSRLKNKIEKELLSLLDSGGDV